MVSNSIHIGGSCSSIYIYLESTWSKLNVWSKNMINFKVTIKPKKTLKLLYLYLFVGKSVLVKSHFLRSKSYLHMVIVLLFWFLFFVFISSYTLCQLMLRHSTLVSRQLRNATKKGRNTIYIKRENTYTGLVITTNLCSSISPIENITRNKT